MHGSWPVQHPSMSAVARSVTECRTDGARSKNQFRNRLCRSRKPPASRARQLVESDDRTHRAVQQRVSSPSRGSRSRGTFSFIDCVRHRPATIVRDFPGENPLHATMVHDLYLVQVLMNRATRSIFSAQFHRTTGWQGRLGTGSIAMEQRDAGFLCASYLTPAGMAPRGFDRMEVFGSGWSARINPNPRPIEVWDRASTLADGIGDPGRRDGTDSA